LLVEDSNVPPYSECLHSVCFLTRQLLAWLPGELHDTVKLEVGESFVEYGMFARANRETNFGVQQLFVVEGWGVS
jgi:hypothetical protein